MQEALEEGRGGNNEGLLMAAPMKISPEIRERLVAIGAIESWDDGSATTREAHDKRICEKYGRPNIDERLEVYMEQGKERARKKTENLRPIDPSVKVVNPWKI